MNRIWTRGQVLAFIMALSGAAWCQEAVLQSPESYIAYADRGYADKTIDEDGRKKIMDLMMQGADTFTGNYEVQWRTAEAIYVYGDILYYRYQTENYEKARAQGLIKSTADVLARSTELTPEQSRTLLSAGMTARRYADRAVALKPEGVEGRYYDAMSIALYSFGKSIVSALLEGLGPKYENNLETALKIKKDYRKGAVFAAYGRYWYKLPWPKKNDRKSLELLRAGEQMDPENPIILDFLGDTLFSKGNTEEAVRYWSRVVDSSYPAYQSSYLKVLAAAKLKYAAR